MLCQGAANQDIVEQRLGTPLVRERPRVQSSLAAPVFAYNSSRRPHPNALAIQGPCKTKSCGGRRRARDITHGLRVAADHSRPRTRRSSSSRRTILAREPPCPKSSEARRCGGGKSAPTVRCWEPIPFATTPSSDLLRFTATLAS